MKKVLILLLSLLALTSCSKVPAGHVGVKVYLLGGNKGVDHEVLNIGRYWIGLNEELYLFPTFQQTYTWTKSPHEGQPVDESITFQTKEGMSVNVDVGISYHLNPDKIATIFQKYRKGIEEITDIYLRNQVRDAINEVGATFSVADIYGEKKGDLLTAVQTRVKSTLDLEGIVIDKVYLVGSMRLPENVVAALNSKIEATQRAQQRENEVAEARAQADKEVAKATGDAKATLTRAEAEAKANKLKLQTLTPELIRYEAIQKWNGQLPTYTGGGAMPFINVENVKATK